MILSHKNLIIHKEKITFKKFKHCSNNFIFIPIQYDQQDIMIQTPHCFVPFGLNQYSTVSKKKYIDLSFQENQKCIKNILYAKIMVKPARAIEFIAIAFVIASSGASFDD